MDYIINNWNIKRMLEYYTPDIEDIRVGYECQIQLIENAQWSNFIVDKSDFEEVNAYEYLVLGNLRTPYLIKEQIEAEGWQAWNRGGIFETYTLYNKDQEYTYILYKDIRDSEYPISIKIKETEEQVYMGSCPSINEFRTIMKLLNV